MHDKTSMHDKPNNKMWPDFTFSGSSPKRRYTLTFKLLDITTYCGLMNMTLVFVLISFGDLYQTFNGITKIQYSLVYLFLIFKYHKTFSQTELNGKYKQVVK